MKILSDNRSVRRLAGGVAVAAVVALLASCGGHDDNDDNTPVATTPTNTPPPSASLDVAGFIAYLKVLVPTKPETSEPLDISTTVAPTTNTAEPDPSI